MTRSAPVGLLLGSMIAPEQIAATARLGEDLGFDELWFAEDFFFTGGISSVTAALDATERIPVGTGIVSALARHPALLAMELATIARMHPGRLWPGIGLGLPDWLRQMGLYPRSPLAAVGECVQAVRELLAGAAVTRTGRSFHFDAVQLTHPPTTQPPIYMGAVGPKMLRLAGEIADGVILPLFAGPAYVAWAREQIDAGAAAAGRPGRRRLVVFAFCSIDVDDATARAASRELFALYLHLSAGMQPLFDAYGMTEELVELGAGGAARVEREMPERWLDELAVIGDGPACAARIQRLLAAGADAVALFPMPHERAEEIVELAAREILPRLASPPPDGGA